MLILVIAFYAEKCRFFLTKVSCYVILDISFLKLRRNIMKKISIVVLGCLFLLLLVGCNNSYRDRVDELEYENQTLRSQLTELQNENKSLKDSLADRNLRISDLEKTISELEADLASSKTLIADLTAERDALRLEVAELLLKIAILDEQIATLLGRIDNTVFVYFTFGTLPTLYASLHFLSHSNPSYVFFTRNDTFDVAQMPNHVTQIRDVTYGTLPSSEIAEIARETIAELEEAYHSPNFHFFVDDLRVLLPYYALLRNEIPESRFRITLLSDGVGTYGGMFTGNGVDNRFVGANGFNNWRDRRTDLNAFWLPLISSENQLTAANYEAILLNFDLAYVASQRTNVEYWMQFPEFGLLRDDVMPEVRAELLRTNLVKVMPFNMLDQLSQTRRDIFFDATLGNPSFAVDEEVSLRTMLDGLFDSEKPVMIISGTHSGGVSGGGYGVPSFLTALENIVATFGDDYVLMYKPHPSWNSSLSGNQPVIDFMAENDIFILPPRLPMEVLMWAYPNVFIGGYSSSLYMSARVEQVRFSIGNFATGGINHNIMYVLYQFGFFADMDYAF